MRAAVEALRRRDACTCATARERVTLKKLLLICHWPRPWHENVRVEMSRKRREETYTHGLWLPNKKEAGLEMQPVIRTYGSSFKIEASWWTKQGFFQKWCASPFLWSFPEATLIHVSFPRKQTGSTKWKSTGSSKASRDEIIDAVASSVATSCHWVCLQEKNIHPLASHDTDSSDLNVSGFFFSSFMDYISNIHDHWVSSEELRGAKIQHWPVLWCHPSFSNSSLMLSRNHTSDTYKRSLS